MLKTFTGYKGKITGAQVGRVEFIICARNPRQLAIIWATLFPDAPLKPADVKNGLVILAADLPVAAPRKSAAIQHQDALDRLNAELAAEGRALKSPISNLKSPVPPIDV